LEFQRIKYYLKLKINNNTNKQYFFTSEARFERKMKFYNNFYIFNLLILYLYYNNINIINYITYYNNNNYYYYY